MAPKFTSMAVSTCDEYFLIGARPPHGAHLLFTHSLFKQPSSIARIVCRGPGQARRRSLLSPLAKARGMARQVAQPLLSCARDPSRDRGAPLGAPPRQACAVRAYLRASSLRRRAALFVAAPNLDDLRQPSSWRAARIGHQAEPRRRPGACLRGTPAGAASCSTIRRL